MAILIVTQSGLHIHNTSNSYNVGDSFDPYATMYNYILFTKSVTQKNKLVLKECVVCPLKLIGNQNSSVIIAATKSEF